MKSDTHRLLIESREELDAFILWDRSEVGAAVCLAHATS